MGSAMSRVLQGIFTLKGLDVCYSTTCTADSIVTVSCRPSRMCLHLLAILTSPDVLPLAWCFVPESFDVHQLRNSASECGQRWPPLLGWSSVASVHAPHLRDKNWALLNTDWVTKLHNIKLAFKTKEKNTTQVTFIYVSLVFICKTYGSSRRNPSTSTFFQQATGLSTCPVLAPAQRGPTMNRLLTHGAFRNWYIYRVALLCTTGQSFVAPVKIFKRH